MYLFWHDLRRLARRGRPALGRTLFGAILLVVLGMVFAQWFPTVRIDQFETTFIPPRRGLDRFGVTWMLTVSAVQLAFVVFMTPLVCGGALCYERTRGTLDLLRLSQSPPMAIVFGKFAARFIHLSSIVMIGLPIGMLGLIWGDISPTLIAACNLINLLVLSAAVALSVWCSSETASVPAGVAASYAAIGFLAILWQFLPWFSPTELLDEWRRGQTVSLTAELLGWPWLYVPLTVVGLLGSARRLSRDGDERAQGFVPMSGSRTAPPAELHARLLAPIETRRFAVLHRPVISMLPRAASLRVLPTPQIREHPMLWKELYFGGNALAGELIRTTAIAIVLIEALVGAFLLFKLMDRADASYAMARTWHGTFQSLAINSLCAALLSVTAFAASSITLEREKYTLDAILGLPEGRPALLLTKWLGSILRVRWVLVVAILPLIGGVAIGAFHGLPVAVLSVAIVIHLMFSASVGIFCSTLFSSSGRAMLSAIVIVMIVTIVPLFFGAMSSSAIGASRAQQILGELGGGLSPVSCWQMLLQRHATIPPETQTARALLNIAGYALAAGTMLAAALWLFDRKRSR